MSSLSLLLLSLLWVFSHILCIVVVCNCSVDSENCNVKSENWLFFGCRHSDRDYLYREDFQQFVDQEILRYLVVFLFEFVILFKNNNHAN